MNAIREGQAAAGVDACHKIGIWDNLMDSKTILLTGNTSTMYAVGFLDLAKDGPVVIDLPQGMLGILDDMAFRYMTDLGVAGPDKGKGGRYLVLPPNYKGKSPRGYYVVPSKTNGLCVFMRGYLDKKLPIEKAIPVASKNIRDNLKVYPLSKRGDQPAMEFVDFSKTQTNTILPNDVSAFEKLHALIQGEPDDYLGPEAKGMMAYASKDTTFEKDGAYNLDARALFHFGVICVSPAMAVTVAGKGSDYGLIALDSNKKALDGSKTYKLHLPPNVPVKDFWARTMYDTQTRSQLQTNQQFPTLGSQTEGVKKNAEGSYDIYFAPKAPKGKEGNWLQTISGKSWWLALRMYGPEKAWIDQTWRPGELELVK